MSSEQMNVLKPSAGPECDLSVGEGKWPSYCLVCTVISWHAGTYKLRDELQLAIPPVHPSDATSHNPNPLSTAPLQPTSGVKLSLVSVGPRRPKPNFLKGTTFANLRSNLATYSIKESEKESRASHDSTSDDAHSQPFPEAVTPAYGADNPLLNTAAVKEAVRRRKPKASVVKSSSSYISRVVPHENLSKRLENRDPDALFAFLNIGRSFQWLDLTTSTAGISHKADHLTKILFTRAHMLAHDVNLVTKSSEHIDVCVGAGTSDILWYEPFSEKYSRINKNGIVNPTPIVDMHWIPGSENLFMVAHQDGHLVVYDKEKEDAPFVSELEPADPRATSSLFTSLRVLKSVNSPNQSGKNPVAVYRVSARAITAFALSPSARHLAVVGEDSTLRVADYLAETLVDVYSSYFGEMTCVCWSPDGKYILTGSQDDLVSIWSVAEKRCVARCEGHRSWPTRVECDAWRCEEGNLRFGSVGEDGRLLLWDFQEGAVGRPRARGSVSSGVVPVAGKGHHGRAESQATTRLRSTSNLAREGEEKGEGEGEGQGGGVEHGVEGQSKVPMLRPILNQKVEDGPLSWLGFEEDCLIACSVNGMFLLLSLLTASLPCFGAEERKEEDILTSC
jgi:WD40 repeat protein